MKKFGRCMGNAYIRSICLSEDICISSCPISTIACCLAACMRRVEELQQKDEMTCRKSCCRSGGRRNVGFFSYSCFFPLSSARAFSMLLLMFALLLYAHDDTHSHLSEMCCSKEAPDNIIDHMLSFRIKACGYQITSSYPYTILASYSVTMLGDIVYRGHARRPG